jgi:mRNA-degrading endonuclease HigB of HigAB toxin-antitoxin module
MSHIEQNFNQFLSKYPELEKCYNKGLINRRSLARYLIKNQIAKPNQLDAVIAMLRRYKFNKTKEIKNIFPKTKIKIKDNIIILDFKKEKSLIKEIQYIINNTDYDNGDTLKIVIGSSSVKVFLDKENEDKLKNIINKYKLNNRLNNISEISIMFPEDVLKEKGIISTLTKELYINDISISEILTASPELLIYLNEEFVINTYDIIKRLQKNK